MTETTTPLPEPTGFSDEMLLKIWEKTVDTQMHFNEMSAKSRQLGLTFVAAALGVAAFLLANSRDYYIHLPVYYTTLHIHISALIFCAAAAGIYAVRELDVNVYHKMLRGAVVFGEDFEIKFMAPRLGLSKGMTQAISHFSRFSDAHTHDGNVPYQYCGSRRTTAGDKVKRFYSVTIGFLIVAAAVTFYATDVSYNAGVAGKTNVTASPQVEAPSSNK
ncbi:hypothetical protein [Rhizobium indicum]|uniref:Transmembrane protein n=1 Tax=Rhizobium indicum TaxID=2583231 RepID=A0ABX6PES3_9HYPH|nr:hypothetical protein [Rhizobium indicum]QKK16814.1 hypothetical protein FFM53_010525 [Rhizobium indicum]